MITSVNEVLYDNQAITATGSGDAISSVYTFTNVHQAHALSQPGCNVWAHVRVVENFNNITNLSIVLQNLIEGGSWATITNLNLLIPLSGLTTAGTAIVDQPLPNPIGDTAAANLTIGVRFLVTYTTSSGAPTTGKLYGTFATEAGEGTTPDFEDQMGDTNVAALQIPTGSGISR